MPERTKAQNARDKLNELAAILLRYKIGHGTEAKMQAQIQAILDAAKIPSAREMILQGGGRLDLAAAYPIVLNEDRDVSKNWKEKLVFGLPFVIAIECKIADTTYDLLSQISGYIQHPDVAAVLVVTSRQAHREMPEELHGKPVAVVWVGGNSL